MNRTSLLTVLVVATLVLAGCAGGSSTATPGGNGTDGAGTDGADDPGGGPVTASDVRSLTLDGIEEVDGYTLNTTLNQTIEMNNVNQSTTTTVNAAVQRNANRIRLNRTQRALGRSTSVLNFVADKTLYQRSDLFVNRYSSKWVQSDISENFSRHWQQFDQLSRFPALFENASLSLAGTETVDGTPTHVLVMDVNTTALERLTFGEDTDFVEFHNVTFSVYVAQDSGRPLRMEGTQEKTVTIRGEDVPVKDDVVTDLTYRSVSVSIPEAAETAVDISNETEGGVGTGGF